jgi:hypothetical protein
MGITREQREKRYKSAPAAVQTLYDADESGAQMFAIFQKHRLPIEKYKAYGLAVVNVMLGFYPQSNLSELLEHTLDIPPVQAREIVADLQLFFEPIQDILAAHPAERAFASRYPAVETIQRPPVTPVPASVLPPPQMPQTIPQYQKPLTFVPPYRNADLYKKPGGADEPPSNLPR